jgi:ubiquitin-protein ligase
MACAIARHVTILTQARSKVLEERVTCLEEKVTNQEKELRETRENATKLYVNNFCRRWIEHKPDALQEFVVYRDRNSKNLLCGVPGPGNTSWEGGLFPVIVRFPDSFDHPPLCQFPPRFHHVNVTPAGTVCMSTLNEAYRWRPDISIPEQLFGIQQLLVHPDPDAPEQNVAYDCYVKRPDEYEQKAKELARRFHRSGNFLATAQVAFREKAENPERWLPVDDRFEFWKNSNWLYKNAQVRKIQENEGDTAVPETLLLTESTCSCSCCAVGKSFWDQKGEMRFMFGSR